MNFRNNALKLQYPPKCPVIVHTTHHASRHFLYKKFALIVGNKK